MKPYYPIRQNIRLEKQIQRDILVYLRTIKITAWLVNSGCFKVDSRFIKVFQDAMGNSISGIPDIMGYLSDGRALYIEVKRPGGKLTAYQNNFLLNAQKSGCVAFMATSIDDVKENLKKSIIKKEA